MSMDKSLKSRDTLRRHRNVLTRAERIVRLQELGTWSDDRSPFGLPKEANRKIAKKGKIKKDADKDVDKEGDQGVDKDGDKDAPGDSK